MRTRDRLFIAIALLLACLAHEARAATEADVYCLTGTSSTGAPNFLPASSTNPCPVSASVSASISGFTAATTGTPISVTTGGVSGTLPAGAVVVATNVGATNGAYCALGASATTASQYLSPGGGWFAFTVGSSTQLTCITSTSTTTVNMTGGAGLPTGAQAGSGGSGSGGAVTLASGAVASGAYASGSLAAGAGTDGWNVTEGAKADSAWSSGSGSIVAILKAIAAGVTGSIPAGTNNIGTVNPTTPGNWGIGTIAAATPTSGVTQGVDAQSSEPAAATTGNLTPMMGDLAGKVVTSPYANRENMVRGSASATGTGATTIIAAQGASVKTYITDIECGRSDAGTTAIIVTLSDAASTILVLPNSGGGGGNNKTFNVPLVTAANTAFTFTAGTGTTTVYCSAQGFKGY